MQRSAIAIALTASLVAGLSGCDAPDSGPSAETPTVSDEALALHAATRAGDLDQVRRLIEAGTPIDAGDRYGKTPLMTASDYGHVDLVRYLLESGADVNHREVFFNTSAFDLALWRERTEVVFILLTAGADQREEAVEAAIRREVPELARAAVKAGPLYASTVEELLAENDLPQEFREVLRSAETRPDPEPPNYTREDLEQFAGLFETWDAEAGEDVAVRVTATDAGIRVTVNADPPVDLSPAGERRFRSGDGEVGASFWGRLGSIETLTLRRGDAPPLRMRQGIGETIGAEGFHGDTAAAGDSAPVKVEDVQWAQFRGASARGVGDGSAVPAEWDVKTGTGVRWQVEIPGLGNSSPIVWGDRIFVTTAVAEGIEQEIRTGLTGAGDPVDEKVEHSWRVIAFDKRTGEKQWETEVGRAVPLTRRHFKASQANSTPATDGRQIVAVFPTAGLACLDLEGKLKWKQDLGGLNASSPNDPGTEWGYASSPVIYEDRVILQVDTYEDPHIAAWDLETGRQLWRTDRDTPPTWATPTVVRHATGDELVVNGPTIHGYDPATGDELWGIGPNSELVIATPVAGDGVVYVSAGYAPIKPIYAVRTGTRGRFEVEPGTQHERLAWSHDRGGAYMPTPLLYQGLLYVVHHNGRIVAYDAEGGAPIYKARFSSGGTFTASPVAANGKLYAPTEEGKVYVIAAGPEYREIAINEMDEPIMATPAFSEGVMFVRTTERLVAIGGRALSR